MAAATAAELRAHLAQQSAHVKRQVAGAGKHQIRLFRGQRKEHNGGRLLPQAARQLAHVVQRALGKYLADDAPAVTLIGRRPQPFSLMVEHLRTGRVELAALLLGFVEEGSNRGGKVRVLHA